MDIDSYLDDPLSDPETSRFYPEEPRLRNLLLTHSKCVALKSVEIARGFSRRHPGIPIDIEFIARGAMLHDIGIRNCDAPSIFCFGTLPYICHGIEGARILAEAGMLRHALVCERHTGSGLTAEEIRDESLPLPERDMLPISIEEKIICYADKFFSKNPDSLTREKSLGEARNSIARFGKAPLERFDTLTSLLSQ